jgi:hypothetical protein
VSTDPLDSHESFCGAEGLAYPLLSDPQGSVSTPLWLLAGANGPAAHVSDRPRGNASGAMGRCSAASPQSGGAPNPRGFPSLLSRLVLHLLLPLAA